MKQRLIDRDDYTLRWLLSWSRSHAARSTLECDHCGEPIHVGDDYTRHVAVMVVRGRSYWIVERTHERTGCNA